MTAIPPKEQFLVSGNVRVADILTSAGNQIDRILNGDGECEARGDRVGMNRVHQLRRLAAQFRRLAEAIEKGGA